MNSCVAIIGSLVHCWNLIAVDKRVHNPLETLLALDHLDNHLSLNCLVIFDNPWFELLVTSSNLGNDIVRFLLKMDLADTNQVE